ncbi:glutathione S-transferase [Kushneria pakistanensis]|uniref:Glutathione S-transferase n=1 Tax=Kushneria pakistanensis TaxID=1508770 RepID=A0ABQ3FLN9_9GAMM|nr:glutathione S-transferase [Kushneria pakistanensis]GHC28367.1 glutathione S-transferase [Kushneria pakistanensis]
MLKVWGRANSTNVKKVLWCADELGLAVERIDAGGEFGVVNEPNYRALNPNGLIPCLQDGDLVLWESNAIVRYLMAQYGDEPMALHDPARRAEADKWMDWATSTLTAPFKDVFLNAVRLPPEQRDTDLRDRGIAECATLLARVDAVLAGQPWLSGQTLGMGDMPLGCMAYAWFEMPIERPELKHLERWYQHLTERAPFQRQVMTPLT